MDEEEQKQRFRRGYVKMVAIFLAAVAIPLILYMLWDKYLNPQTRRAADSAASTEQYQAATKAYEDAMRADTYGGKTPQETLSMLIDALKKGDIGTAAMYFELEQNPNDPNYLTRKKWEDGLNSSTTKANLPQIIDSLSRAKPAGSAVNNYFGFEVRDDSGDLISDVGLKLNKFSNVWKIESL